MRYSSDFFLRRPQIPKERGRNRRAVWWEHRENMNRESEGNYGTRTQYVGMRDGEGNFTPNVLFLDTDFNFHTFLGVTKMD